MSAPFNPPNLPPSARRTIATAGTITGRLLVAVLFLMFGSMFLFVGIVAIRSDVDVFATWRTAVGAMAVAVSAFAFESVASILLRMFRP